MPVQTMYRLDDADLLRRVMRRTGTGCRITTRQLAEASGVPNGTIGSLLSGTQHHVPEERAKAIAAVIGVDLMILFIPVERAGRRYVLAGASA